MAPLIDVVFLLLVFFMLTSSFVPPSLPLRLPEAAAQESVDPHLVIVSLDSEGTLSIGDQVVVEADFERVLREAMAGAGTTTVHFRGDRDSGYGDFLELMARARGAGAGQFNLIHTPRP
jgi:biopolymer transport protein ExbD